MQSFEVLVQHVLPVPFVSVAALELPVSGFEMLSLDPVFVVLFVGGP